MQDDYFIIHSSDGYDSLLESVFKTEILTCLTKAYKAQMSRDLPIVFANE